MKIVFVLTTFADNDAIVDIIFKNRDIANILVKITRESFTSNNKNSCTECYVLISQLLSGNRSNFGPSFIEAKILDLLYDLKDWNYVPAIREKLLITHNLLSCGSNWVRAVLNDSDLIDSVLESMSHLNYSVRKDALELMIQIIK